jgi:hypothetical protein
MITWWLRKLSWQLTSVLSTKKTWVVGWDQVLEVTIPENEIEGTLGTHYTTANKHGGYRKLVTGSLELCVLYTNHTTARCVCISSEIN